MRRSIWGPVAAIVAVLVGSSYLSRTGAVQVPVTAMTAWGARVSAWTTEAGVPHAAREIAFDVTIRTLLATSSLRSLVLTHRGVAALATGMTLLLAAVVLTARARRRATPGASVWRLARGGASVPTIARRTRLAQDAVRALAGGRELARRRVG